MAKPTIAVHGGAGTILRSQMTEALEAEYRHGLEQGLRAGWNVLEEGGDSLDAVVAAVCALEDHPLFNAGRGSVFTHEGKVELDAAVMNGNDMKAGAVAFVTNIRNPIRLARLVMERTEHVLLAGDGADQFAHEMGVEFESDEYFFTEHRWRQLIEARDAGRIQLDHSIPGISPSQIKPMGTVGAVACDHSGRLASATSTGGLTNKKFGRVGDTAIVGAGTYADDICAVSCTGHGEYFIRGVAAYDVAARMKYQGRQLGNAASATIEHLGSIGGEGGLIAVDADGNVALPFNSEGMYRGHVNASGIVTEIYGNN